VEQKIYGKAAILSESDFSKIRKQIRSQKYKILLDLAWYTGERWGALIKLKISDIYNSDGSVRAIITFRSSTRKKRSDGTADTRQVPIHPALMEVLQNYLLINNSVWMFPNREGNKPMCWKNAYNIFMSAVDRAGLSSKGISTHSTRRTFITKLHNNGVATATIKRITGHRDYKSLDGYIDINADEIKGAIFAL
jgi:integrase/recombinase XerD